MSDAVGEEEGQRYGTYGSLIISVQSQVATIRLVRPADASRASPPGDIHWELQVALNRIREDHSVRVIVLTGVEDGEFWVPGMGATRRHTQMSLDPAQTWTRMLGIIRLHTTMAEIEKPLIAKVNGDAIGFGQSIMFSCDLIVAREDAIVNDVHLGQGQAIPGRESMAAGIQMGIVPGNGAGATLPLFMTPVKAKEYLMLAKSLTATELAEMNCINYAVPQNQLADKVDDLVRQLLSKSAYALAWTKRLTSRHVVDQLNRALDAGIAYQMLSVLQATEVENRTTLT